MHGLFYSGKGLIRQGGALLSSRGLTTDKMARSHFEQRSWPEG